MNDFILNWNQKRILKKAGFLKKYGFYLAGGTALALQFGHRTSRDLDFYTQQHFKGLELVRGFKKVFGREIEKPGLAEDTLWLKIKDTDLSFFRYPYKMLRPFIPYLGVNLASPEDIAAMKIETIIGRGSKRDFVDIYYLMKKYGLKQLLNFTQKKYPEAFNEQNCLSALIYFKDAEAPQKDRKRLYLYETIKWAEIKRYIEKEVKEYQLSLLTNY